MNKKQDSTINRLLNFASQCKGKMIASVILAILGVASGMIPYIVVAKIIVDIVNGVNDFSLLINNLFIVLLGYTGKVLFHSCSTYLSHDAAFTIMKNIRLQIISKLSKIPMGDVKEIPSGKLKTSIVDTVEKLEQPLAHIIPEMTSNLLVPICILCYLLYLDWRMALISLVTLPIGMIFYKKLMKKYMLYYGKKVEAGMNMNSTVVEYVNGIEAIKAFNQSSKSYKKYSDAVRESRNAIVSFFENTLVLYTLVMTIMPSTLVFTLPAGMIFYINGTLSIADFITCIILSFSLVAPLMQAMQYTDGLASMGTTFEEIYGLLNKEEMNRPKQYKKIDNYEIQFKNVSFGYGEEEILHDVSFKTKANGMTAIVGPSGSGKSTTAKLMSSFWDVKKGEISIGNVDIRKIPLEQVSDIISYVSQENFLFNLTIAENIRIGKKDASDEEVMEAAKKASCHEFIMSLENGYDTLAGEGGRNFSGGERQRISIARAILKNSPVILLDEATAYTDPENEAIIQESIAKLVQGKTLIVIAHRLSTIVDADNIVVMNKGKVEAQGTQSQLLKSCPLYKKLWNTHISSKDKDTIEGGVKVC